MTLVDVLNFMVVDSSSQSSSVLVDVMSEDVVEREGVVVVDSSSQSSSVLVVAIYDEVVEMKAVVDEDSIDAVVLPLPSSVRVRTITSAVVRVYTTMESSTDVEADHDEIVAIELSVHGSVVDMPVGNTVLLMSVESTGSITKVSMYEADEDCVVLNVGGMLVDFVLPPLPLPPPPPLPSCSSACGIGGPGK